MSNRRIMRPAGWLGLVAMLVVCLASSLAHAEAELLFVIARSTNRNVVHYRLRLDGGMPNRQEPIAAHWIMHEEGGRREPLTWLEQKLAYGWEVVGPIKADGFGLKLVAFDRRVLRIVRHEGRYRAQLPIAGRPAYLTRIFVRTRGGAGIPKVLYVELRGTDSATSEPLTERLSPTQF